MTTAGVPLRRRATKTTFDDIDREILALVAVGRSTAKIAPEVGLAFDTVKNRIDRARVLLGVGNRAGLAAAVTERRLREEVEGMRAALAEMEASRDVWRRRALDAGWGDDR